MSDGFAQDQLQAYVRRVESVEDEIKALNEDKSSIYKEARGDGFNVKILRKVIAARRMDADEWREQGELFELYWGAVHGVEYRVVRAHVEPIEQFPVEHDADGVVPDDEIDALPTVAAEVTTPDANTHGQTGTADNSGLAANVPANAEAVAKKVGQSEQEATVERCVDNLTTFTPKPLRPYCLNTDKCGGQGRQHCWSCQKAHDDKQGVA